MAARQPTIRPGEHLDHEGPIDHARPCWHIGEADNPEPVGVGRPELPINPVSRSRGALRGHHRELATPRCALPSLSAVEAFNGAAGNPIALTTSEQPHRAATTAAHEPVLLTKPHHGRNQFLIAALTGVLASLAVLIIGTRGDRDPMSGQHTADRLESETVAVGVDGGDYNRCGRSSSAAKKAEAAFKISSARRSSAFSFRRRFNSADSSLAVPGCFPASTSACFTQTRNHSGEAIPSIAATALITAARSGQSLCDPNTIRTARSRSPNRYLETPGMRMIPSNEFTLRTRQGASLGGQPP